MGRLVLDVVVDFADGRSAFGRRFAAVFFAVLCFAIATAAPATVAAVTALLRPPPYSGHCHALSI